jgi:hypothetical protein
MVTEKGPNDPSQGERDIEFRSQGKTPRLMMVIAILANSDQLSLDQWVHTYAACLPGTVTQGEVAGVPAIFCTSQPLDVNQYAVAFEHAGNVFLLTALESFSEFPSVVTKFQVSGQ